MFSAFIFSVFFATQAAAAAVPLDLPIRRTVQDVSLRRGPFRKRVDIPMLDQSQDVSYYAEVGIGTPPQMFQLVLDTGSSDLWVAVTGCTVCDPVTPKFNSTKSSTFVGSNTPLHIPYGSGEISGFLSSDTVTMSNYTLPAQALISATTISSGLISGAGAGIIGLAFPPLSVSNTNPFWLALIQKNQLPFPEFSFWFTRHDRDPNDIDSEVSGGVFTLGGTNSSLYTGDIDFLPSNTNLGFWTLTVNTITVNGKNIPITGGRSALSIIDTGTTLMTGPTTDVLAFWAAVPGSQPLITANDGTHIFPCTTNISSSVSFGNKTWSISSDDMNTGIQVSGGMCIGALSFTPADAPFGWAFGGTFLKNVYSVFRNSPGPSIGFAQLSTFAATHTTA